MGAGLSGPLTKISIDRRSGEVGRRDCLRTGPVLANSGRVFSLCRKFFTPEGMICLTWSAKNHGVTDSLSSGTPLSPRDISRGFQERRPRAVATDAVATWWEWLPSLRAHHNPFDDSPLCDRNGGQRRQSDCRLDIVFNEVDPAETSLHLRRTQPMTYTHSLINLARSHAHRIARGRVDHRLLIALASRCSSSTEARGVSSVRTTLRQTTGLATHNYIESMGVLPFGQGPEPTNGTAGRLTQ